MKSGDFEASQRRIHWLYVERSLYHPLSRQFESVEAELFRLIQTQIAA